MLGSFQVMLDEQPVIHFDSNKVRALLSYLAVESDRPHSREFLADLLWPYSTHTSALGNLRYTISCLRKTIRDRQLTARDPASLDSQVANDSLSIWRDRLQFNSTACTWVDVIEFNRLLQANYAAILPIDSLARAASLYRGSFLEGFFLPDNAAFDEWILLKREQYNRLMLKTLYQLADFYEGQGDYERAQHYAWRQVEIEPWLEEGYQQLMRVLALGGQRSLAIAQYEICRKLLSTELRILPSQETERIYHLVSTGDLNELRNYHLLSARASRPTLPAMLSIQPSTADLCVPDPAVVINFVDREAELTRLEACLEWAVSGHGQIVFIIGQPGSGKTALADEFTRRALASHPTVVAAAGSCSAHTGICDPYLPFVEILQTLTGDYEGHCLTDTARHSMVERLQALLPESIHAVAELGSELVVHLLNLETLVERARTLPSPTSEHIQNLLSHVQPGHIHKDTIQPAINEQITHVLLTLARSHPLLLIVDDLQWADRATIGMLFHLGRRLSASRVLILGLYRPGDLYSEPGNALHPLEQVIDELLAEYGDLTIDLSLSDCRKFLDAYLDRIPNRYSPEFRQQLFRYTNGNPLITIELLKNLQALGDIYPDENGYWVSSEYPHWDALPPRLKASIDALFHRLRPVWQRLLQAASIEGQSFIAEVAAQLTGVNPQAAIGWLSGPLSRNFHLVEGLGVQHTKNQHLSFYRFQTPLYQIHLYHQLDVVERISLHELAAAQLETLFHEITSESGCANASDFAAEIASRLVWHYGQAGLPEMAAKYFIQPDEHDLHLVVS